MHPNRRMFPASASPSSRAPDGVAYSSSWPDLDRDGRLRLAQREGGPVEEIRPGDVIWFPPGEKHWHGATATTAMTHIAIQEKRDGRVVDWMEKVSDEQYRAWSTIGKETSHER